jgi:HEAT repeat protein
MMWRTLLVLGALLLVGTTVAAQDTANGRRRCEWEGWLPPDSGRARVRRAGHLDSAREKALRDRLGDSSAVVRDAAARALGASTDPHTADVLAGLLHDPNGVVRDGAIRALGRIGDQRAVPWLRLMARDTSKHVRQAVIWSLGQIQSDKAEQTLLEASRDGNAHVRAEAGWALGLIDDPRVASRVAELAADPEPSIRQAAVCSAATMLRRGVVPAATFDGVIAHMERDANAQVRDAAAWAAWARSH